jgi:hypothetical protein
MAELKQTERGGNGMRFKRTTWLIIVVAAIPPVLFLFIEIVPAFMISGIRLR